MTQSIIPRYKLIICYDINVTMNDAYYQFVLGELAPLMQKMGLYMLQAYHTAYGDYPQRQLEFVAEDIEAVRAAMNSNTWQEIRQKFDKFTLNYSQKIVHFRDEFQFYRP